MSDDERVEQVLDELDPTPAHEAEWPVSRRATLRALASVGALSVAPTAATAQSAGTVIADEAFLSNYSSTSTAPGYDLTIDGDTFAFDGDSSIGLPDGGSGTKVVTPSGSDASAVVGPDGETLWEAPVPGSGVLVDDFEDGGLSEYSGATAEWTVVQSGSAAEGGYALQKDNPNEYGNAIYSLPGDGLANYPANRDANLTVLIRDPVQVGPHFGFGLEDDNGTIKGYAVWHNNDSNYIELLRFDDFEAFTNTSLDLVYSDQTTAGDWYYFQIERSSDGTINASFYDLETGQQIGSTLSANDSTHTADEGIGFLNFSFEASSDSVVCDYVTTSAGQ